MTNQTEVETSQPFSGSKMTTCVQRYGEQFDWVRDAKFLRELENDSIDLETIEDELAALRESQHASTRRKIVQTLRRNPVQLALCVLVLLDVAIGIAQLLIDIHAVREQLTIRENELSAILRYVCDNKCNRTLSQVERDGYVRTVIDLLRTHPSLANYHHVPLSTNQWHSTLHSKHYPSRLSSAVNMTSLQSTVSPSVNLTVSQSVSPSRRQHSRRHQYDVLPNTTTYDDFNATVNELRDINIVHLMRIAYILHCIGISILGVLLFEDIVKIIAMGQEFFRHKIEIVDAIVISISFVFDIIFLSDIYGSESEKAAALIVVLLLWRIARITDSILITVKQRQEFRIRLQKAARRKAEKKLEHVDEDRQLRMREVAALRELCLKANLSKEEVDSCNPEIGRRTSSTLHALDSVARLSLCMTMSLSSSTVFPLLADDKFMSVSEPRSRVNSDDALELSPLAARFFSHSVPVTPVLSRPRGLPPSSLGLTSLPEHGSASAMTLATATENNAQLHEQLRKRESPVNVTGVSIVIDEGSDLDLHHVTHNATTPSDMTTADSGFYSYLAVEGGCSAASSRRTSSSAGSDVYLLANYT